MDKQQVERLIEENIDWTIDCSNPCFTSAKLVSAILQTYEEEIAKLKRDEQLAILPCGHNAAWADDDGCKACEYEKQIAKLIALLR